MRPPMIVPLILNILKIGADVLLELLQDVRERT